MLAPILEMDEALNFINKSKGYGHEIFMTSGGFDPIHPGHISVFSEIKNNSNKIIFLIAVVNGDWFLSNKKGYVFQKLDIRCQIVSAINGVDLVVPFEIENDNTVILPLRKLKPDVFVKGGDRISKETIPEWDVCKELNITILTGVGDNKVYSSKMFLDNIRNVVNKSWGGYEIIHKGNDYLIKRLWLNPESRTSYQLHKFRSEFWLVTQGLICVHRPNFDTFLGKGESIFIEQSMPHELYNGTNKKSEIIEVWYGDKLDEDDIVRI